MAEKWLVIDDSATIQRVIKLAFQDYDVLITEADSCQEALLELSRTQPTLVIADAALAGVQSIRDFTLLQQSAPEPAFVILGGSYDHIDEAQFRSAGFRYFLKKPFDASQLIQVTRQALGREISQRGGEKRDTLRPAPVPVTPSAELQPPPPPAFTTSRIGEESKANQLLPDVDLGFDDGPSSQAFGGDTRTGGVPLESETTNSKMPLSFSLDEDLVPAVTKGAYNSLGSMLEPMLQEEMAKLVRQSVEDYCRKNFASIAREMIQRELDKLTGERSRLLVDK